MAAKVFDLSTLVGFTAGVRSGSVVREIHCPQCAAPRRVFIRDVQDPDGKSIIPLASVPGPPVVEPPFVAIVRCLECQSNATAVVFESPSGPDLAILWSVAGGLSTPNTPESVRYYLDQAARSESVGARSAAVVMYRAALEHLLLEQGYTDRMLGPKLKQVDADIRGGTPKAWARDLAPALMNVFRRLGNASIHADDTDTSGQEAIDAALLADLHVAMEGLLEAVYEQPKKAAERLARLDAGAVKLGK